LIQKIIRIFLLQLTGARVKDPAAIPRQLFLVELTGVEKGMMGNS